MMDTPIPDVNIHAWEYNKNHIFHSYDQAQVEL